MKIKEIMYYIGGHLIGDEFEDFWYRTIDNISSGIWYFYFISKNSRFYFFDPRCCVCREGMDIQAKNLIFR